MTEATALPADLLRCCTLPDYRHSLANLAARLYDQPGCPPLQHPALAGLEQDETVILLLIDGMGCAQLDELVPGGWLQQQQVSTLHSVFPSTTTAAITTLLTGLPPSQHSLLGWHVAAPEANGIVTPLPLRYHWLAEPARALDNPALASTMYSRPSALHGQNRQHYILQPAYIADSAYSRHHAGEAEHLPWQDYTQLFASLQTLAQQAGRKLVYAYVPDLDSLMHHKGTGHPRARLLLERLQRHCAELAASLPAGCRLLITADHGQADVPAARMLFLNDFPELAAMLRQPLSGEPRAAFFHVKPGLQQAFRDAVTQTLGHAAWCLPAADVLAAGWFGPAPAHPQLAERCGDFLLLMKEDWGLMQTLGDAPRPVLVGNHGGLAAAEMQIPLIVASGQR